MHFLYMQEILPYQNSKMELACKKNAIISKWIYFVLLLAPKSTIFLSQNNQLLYCDESLKISNWNLNHFRKALRELSYTCCLSYAPSSSPNNNNNDKKPPSPNPQKMTHQNKITPNQTKQKHHILKTKMKIPKPYI